MEELADWQLRLLAEQRAGHLATVDALGRPQVVPVCFVQLEGELFTPIDEKPKRAAPASLARVKNLLARPAVCLTVDRYDEEWSRLAWLQWRGPARLVDEPSLRARALAALRGKYAQYRTMDLEARPLIGIELERLVGWRADGE